MFRRLFPVLLCLTLAKAAEHRVSSAAELAGLSLAAGDTVVMADGSWKRQRVVLHGKGTEDHPITLRAATAGMVLLEDNSSIQIDGEHLVVAGLWVKDGSVELKGRDNRLTGCAVTGGKQRNFLHLHGQRHRVDQCHFSGKTTEGPTVQVEVEESPNQHRIDHNHFGARPPLGRNGGETIRIGYSHQATRSSGTVVEQNLFEGCDGELEIISNKSCDNIYRANTFRECAGFLTLRHGDRCRVEGNFFFGRLKRGSGGIRVIGHDHVVANNFIDSVAEGAIRLTSGIPNGPATGYVEARNVAIVFNTVTDSPGATIELDAGIGSAGRTLRPENIVIAHNVFSLPQRAVLTKGTEGAGFRWTGNFSNRAGDHVRKADLMLTRDLHGVWRPSPGSPLQAAAEAFPGIGCDLDGQPRTGRFDAGCDEISQAPAIARPLTTADTGPAWMRAPKTNFSEILAHDRERILIAAEAALKREPLTITTHRAKLSEGGPNDFYSNGDYWWPDPKKPDGLPYIKRDGETNPENFTAHRDTMRELRDAVAALAAAWLATGDAKYPAKAAALLHAFFLDPATRMNPHLKYAQAIPGVTPGRGIGIIDTLHLIEIPKAVKAMENSPAFTPELREGLRTWFRDYAKWMSESKNGKEEAVTKNNHAVAYFLQLAVFAEFTDDRTKLAECRGRFKEAFVPLQMAEDGSFPQELARTKPYGYSIFQLDNVATLCQVLSTSEENLWEFELPDGRGIRRAMAFLQPYLADKGTWPHPPDVQAWDGWPARQPCLLFAGLACGEARYVDLWKKLEPDPQDAEVRRNIAITQPVLWLRR
ncbi:alginate lyase family protein [Luteolibacter arcticus]|uniref:Alginate lyase family protein n=1 Tax=Luteolibacter arcticus TaxID=1581411 RepID=A0ABT3GMF2_9BACT|nr:alginate lyase family protein [Luteolibacter arcticus]MCW1924684.1 alginate lyase family protein [Luteolibacter arcticus]